MQRVHTTDIVCEDRDRVKKKALVMTVLLIESLTVSNQLKVMLPVRTKMAQVSH